MARARTASIRETTPTVEEEEKAADEPAAFVTSETVDDGEPHADAAAELEPAAAAAEELAIPTASPRGHNPPVSEQAMAQLVFMFKEWVRREMTLAACGVDEEERKKQNP